MIAPALKLRPLTLPDILDEAFRIYRGRFPLLAGLSLGTYLPVLLITAFTGGAGVFAAIYAAAMGAAVPPSSITPDYSAYLSLLLYPIQIAIAPLHYSALAATAVWAVLGYTPNARSLFSMLARTYFPSALLALMLAVVGGLAIFCFPLGIWLLVKLALTYSAYYAEGTGFSSALQRSWSLTRHFFWRTLGLLAILVLLFYAITYALIPLISLASILPGLPLFVRGGIFVAALGIPQQIIEPLIAVAITLIYFDLRVRKEAFDLEMMAYQVAAEPSR